MPTTLAPPYYLASFDCLGKQEWHSTVSLPIRRRVLLQILLLLKARYGKVDPKISYIARRAELALFSQAFSAAEYRNPKTLNRRLQCLVIKLHVHHLMTRDDTAAGTSMTEGAVPRGRKRTPSTCHGAAQRCLKRPRADPTSVIDHTSAQPTPPVLDGDLLRHMCTFLSSGESLRLASTCQRLARTIPDIVSSVELSPTALASMTAASRSTLVDRFPNLQHLAIVGVPQTPRLDVHQDMALVRHNVACQSLVEALGTRSLPKLRSLRLDYAYIDGPHDPITARVAEALLSGNCFPVLEELSLVGNVISDDGVGRLCDAVTQRPSSSLRRLHLGGNFIGERGSAFMAAFGSA